ncbi:zinc finger BED domain-containing protein RICESLEEPER 2 [Daphnia magna]|uniref:zinc finger BED domain-containing protein RICESLEEPER 2 n=1 Tax=Daphnia magna TaxID=35525 RepID=UPI001E1BC5D8|nr:zinc finger BED domain-containing protein RICESLEEPER 2 [Daphnia magna]
MADRLRHGIQRVWKDYDLQTSHSLPLSSNNGTVTRIDSGNRYKSGTSTKSKIDNDYIAKVCFGSSLQPNEPRRADRDELREYEAEETEPTECDPTSVYDYWATRTRRWPQLCAMAKDLLCIPATSAASERVFSAGKDVFGIARMSLNPETVEALVCLRSWYRAGLVNEDDIEGLEEIEELKE